MSRDFKFLYQLLIKICTLGYFYLIWQFFNKDTNNNLLSLVIVLYLTGVIYYYILKKIPDKGMIFFLPIAFVAFISLSIIFKVVWILLIIFLAYLFRRISENKEGDFIDSYSRELTLAISLFIFSSFVGNLDHHPFGGYPAYILLIQFFILFAGHSISLIFDSKTSGRVKQKLITQFTILIAGVSIVSFILSLSVSFIRSLAGSIFSFIMIPIMWIISPIMKIINSFFNSTLNDSEYVNVNGEDIWLESRLPFLFQEKTSSNEVVPLVIFAIILIIVAIIVSLLVKVRHSFSEKKIESIYHVEEEIQDEKFSLNFNQNIFKKSPSHPIRKAMYHFERMAKKYHKERGVGETVQEWCERIHITDKEVITIYENVRYGELVVSEEQVQSFTSYLKSIEKNWKNEKTKKIN